MNFPRSVGDPDCWFANSESNAALLSSPERGPFDGNVIVLNVVEVSPVLSRPYRSARSAFTTTLGVVNRLITLALSSNTTDVQVSRTSRTIAACRLAPYCGNSEGSFAWVAIRSNRSSSSAKLPTDSRPAAVPSIRAAAALMPSAVPSDPAAA